MMNKKNNQRVKLTIRLLQESLIKLLKDNSLYDITITELCQEAEINRSTFYKYYNSIRGLYEELEQMALRRSAECLESMDLRSESAVVSRIEALLVHIRENSELYTLLFANSAGDDFTYRLIMQTTGFVELFPEVIPEDKRNNAEYCSLFVTAGALSIIVSWLRNGAEDEPSELASLIFGLAADALSFSTAEA